MRTRAMARGRSDVTVGVEPHTGIGEQGGPSYGSSVDISCRAVRSSEMVTNADGTETEITLTLFVPWDVSQVPAKRDRVTEDGETFIVHQRKTVQNLQGDIDHYTVMCKDETSG